MAFISSLVQLGFNPQQAKHLGWDVETDITATANNTASGAYQLTKEVNRVKTVTATNNSVILPLIATWPTKWMLISNEDPADTLNIFPASGNTINAGSSFTRTTFTWALFFAVTASDWMTVGG